MPFQRLILTVAVLALPVMAADAASAQSTGSAGFAQFQAGYGASRYTTAQPASGSTRDANGNRLIVNGIIQSGASSYSRATAGSPAATPAPDRPIRGQSSAAPPPSATT